MEVSHAQEFLLLPQEEALAKIEAMTEQEAQALLYDWAWNGRPSQFLPAADANPNTEDGSWTFWLLMAGRGFGKTRTGAETVREWVKTNRLVNLVGPTADDARDIMIEGESGILAICPKGERPTYRPSKRRLDWPNGARSLIFTADEPDRLRGKQHMKVWAEELRSWRYAEDAWDQIELGLRLGDLPQAIITSTPRPTKTMKQILADPSTIVTRGSTSANRANLAAAYLNRMLVKYEGTRIGRQELDAEMLTDNPGALWQRGWIDKNRVSKLPDLVRIVVAVDPAVTSNEDSDETGIVVVGMDAQNPPHYYVLADLTVLASPEGWARVAVVKGYIGFQADKIVGEVNNGGDLVESVIRHVQHEGKPVGQDANYSAVRASRGKAIRAEPISALYEQDRVHHHGAFGFLEDQLVGWDPQTDTNSPDRLDALVWGLTELSEGRVAMNINDDAIGSV